MSEILDLFEKNSRQEFTQAEQNHRLPKMLRFRFSQFGAHLWYP